MIASSVVQPRTDQMRRQMEVVVAIMAKILMSVGSIKMHRIPVYIIRMATMLDRSQRTK